MCISSKDMYKSANKIVKVCAKVSENYNACALNMLDAIHTGNRDAIITYAKEIAKNAKKIAKIEKMICEYANLDSINIEHIDDVMAMKMVILAGKPFGTSEEVEETEESEEVEDSKETEE